MVEYGRKTGEALKTLKDQDERLNAQYYDGQWVFLRIAEYTGEKQPWTKYANEAAATYERHMQENDARVMGYRKFPHGLYAAWKLHGDEKAREQLLRMRENSVFSDPTLDKAKKWYQQRYSREVAYSLQTEVLAARAGAGDAQRTKHFADMALRHIKAWTEGDYVSGDKTQRFCKPFMAGLTASSLIAYYEHTAELGNPDERVPKAIRTLADWLWAEMWVADVDGSGYGAFKYIAPPQDGKGGGGPAPDLNQLIAPMYGWLYQHTGKAKYAKRGDAIFAAGVELAYVGSGKQFNQSYRSSFDYLMWRAAGNGGSAKNRPTGPTIAWSPAGS
ncbi:MAG: hypothetical protein WD382_04205 [Halofilum sp. (in: g-proteobacteria)]